MSNLFERFSYRSLRNEAHVEYHGLVVKLIEKFKPDTLGIGKLYDNYKAKYGEEVSVLDMVQKNEYTQEIVEQDNVRDSIVYGFTTAVKSALNHYDSNMRAAARKVEMVLKSYGNIPNRSYDRETAAIDDLIRELGDSRKNEIHALNLQVWLEKMSQANFTFRELMNKRYSDTAQRPTLNMRETRQEVDQIFSQTLNFIEALVMVNGLSQYDTFIKELNAISTRYKNLLAQAEGKRKSNN